MNETIYTQEPGKYHVQKTVGGYVVVFIENENTSRNVDGGKVHKNRQNAYKKADRLNHPIKYALKKTGMAAADFDGYTVGVNEEQEGYSLYIQKEAMPPHFSTECATLAEVEKEMEESFFPKTVHWYKVNPEEI